MGGTIDQEKIKSILDFRRELEKSRLNFINTYTRSLVSYFVSFFFLLLGATFFITNTPIQDKLLFLGIVILIFLISCLIHGRKVFSIKKDPYGQMFLLGNIFGFLFNAVYLVATVGSGYGFHVNLGGIENFVLEKSDGLNLIEMMYSFVFSLLFITLMMVLVSYGLSLKNKSLQEKNKFMAAIFYAVAIIAGFSIFLFILLLTAYPKAYNFFIYLTVGSMLFIYTENLFKKNSPFNTKTFSESLTSV